MRVLNIVSDTIVDGPGLRTAVYFAGCKHHCKGCHNPQSWNFDQGVEYNAEELFNKIKETGNLKVTLSGGDPLFQSLDELLSLLRWLYVNEYEVWIYTGYEWEDLIFSPTHRKLLEYVDVVVDGPFIEELKDLSLDYRGSSNQRIIDVQKSLQSNEIVLWKKKN